MNGALSPGRDALVALSAALGARRADVLEAALRRAAAEAACIEVEEAILQSYLFLGYPAALNAFAAWREISGVPSPPASAERGPWEERGAQVCRTVYAGQYESLRANVRRLHPDMERWMVEEGYGKVLGRSGLSLVDRELCVCALLAALDAPRQLYSHARGALNAGALPEEVEHALALAAEVSEAGARERAARTWESVRIRAGGDG